MKDEFNLLHLRERWYHKSLRGAFPSKTTWLYKANLSSWETYCDIPFPKLKSELTDWLNFFRVRRPDAVALIHACNDVVGRELLWMACKLWHGLPGCRKRGTVWKLIRNECEICWAVQREWLQELTYALHQSRKREGSAFKGMDFTRQTKESSGWNERGWWVWVVHESQRRKGGAL